MTSSIDANTGSAIQLRRESRGWSKNLFSQLLQSAGLENFHPTTISRTETGERSLRVAEIYVIAAVLECGVEELISSNPDASPRMVTFTEACEKASYYLGMAKRLGQPARENMEADCGDTDL